MKNSTFWAYIAVSCVVASIVGWLPATAALLSAVWFLIQIAEKVFGEKIHFTIMRLVNCFRKKPDA